jgi:hypothetical protein
MDRWNIPKASQARKSEKKKEKTGRGSERAAWEPDNGTRKEKKNSQSLARVGRPEKKKVPR